MLCKPEYARETEEKSHTHAGTIYIHTYYTHTHAPADSSTIGLVCGKEVEVDLEVEAEAEAEAEAVEDPLCVISAFGFGVSTSWAERGGSMASALMMGAFVAVVRLRSLLEAAAFAILACSS